jgi:hypothetical protein
MVIVTYSDSLYVEVIIMITIIKELQDLHTQNFERCM